MQYGRKDATEKEAKSIGSAPCPKQGVTKFKDQFLQKGFDDKEITALGIIYSLGKIQHRNQLVRNQQPIIDNYFYKTILNGDTTHPIQQVLSDPTFKPHVELFASS